MEKIDFFCQNTQNSCFLLKIGASSAIIIVLENNLNNFAKENGMKNLKKILLAVLILALLATAVVVTVLAEDGDEELVYNGTVAEARKLLDAVEDMKTDKDKSAQLKKVYSYIYTAGDDSLVNPDEDGFEDLMLDYSNMTLRVAQSLFSAYRNAESADDKESVLMSAYSHYKGAPVYEGYESLNKEGYAEWQAFRKNYTIEAVKALTPYLKPIREAKTLEARHEALSTAKLKFKAMYFMLPYDDDATYEIDGLSDFVNEFNDWCLSVASEYIDLAATPEEMTLAREKWIEPDNAYSTDAEYFNERYLPLVEKMDLAIIKFASELADKVVITPENYKGEGAEALDALYTYIEKTACIALTRTQLADTVGASHEALQIRVNRFSHEMAVCYYNEVAKLIEGDEAKYADAISDFVEFLESCPAIIYRPAATPDSYNGELSAAEELLLSVRDEEWEYLDSFASLYSYLSKTAVDPDSEGAAEFYNDYESLKLEVSEFVVRFLKNLDSAPTVKGGVQIDEAAFRRELEKLGKIAAFLNTTPVSSSAITEYNNVASAFLETIEKLWCRQIEYKATVNGEAVGDVSAALALLEAVDLTSENALEAYAALYEYVTKTPINSSLEGAADFYSRYAELTARISRLIGKKIDSIATKPAYIDIFASDCPELTYTVPAVNTLDGKLEVANLLVGAVNELIDSGAELSEIFASYVLAYEYNYDYAIKPDVSGAENYFEAFEALTEDVSELVVEALAELDAAPKTEDEDGNEILDAEALKESSETLALIAACLKECPVTLTAVEEYNKVRAAFAASIAASYGSEYNDERFNSDLTAFREIADYLTKTPVSEALFGEYNVKASELMVSLAALNCPAVAEKAFAAESLDGKLDEAELLLEAVKANEKERLAAYTELYQYVKNNAISPEEDGSDFFYSEYANLTAAIAEEMIAKIKTLNSSPLVFDIEYPQIIFTALEPLTYTGNLADASFLLNKVRYALGDANPDVNEIMAAYAELASYMRRNAVPTDADGASKFYADFNSANASVSALVVSELEKLSTLEECSAILTFIRDCRVSPEVVSAYNEKLALIKSSFDGSMDVDAEAFEASLQSIVEIAEFLKMSPLSVETVTAYNSTLHGFTVSLKAKLDAEYDGFVLAKESFDSYLKAANERLSKLEFTALPDDVDYEAFDAGIALLENYVKVKTITDYIYADGLSSIDENREAFAKSLNDIIAATLLEYTPVPESDIYSGSVAEAQAIIDRYNAASSADLKAEIYKELFTYIKSNAMNPKLHGYLALMAEFDAIGEEVYKSFISKIDAAANTDAAIKEMRDYLEEIPISEAAVNAYNTKYLYTYNDKLNATYASYSAAMLKLHEFIESFEGANELIESFEGFSSAIDNYETLETVALVQLYVMKSLNEDPNTISVTGRGVAITALNNYVRKYPISESSYAYEETMADVNEISGAYEQLVEQAKLALDDKAPLEDYFNNSYSFIADNDDGKLGFSLVGANPAAGTVAELCEDTARGGLYAKYSYGSYVNAYLSKNGLPGASAFVMEFDLTGDDGVTYFSVDKFDRPANYGYVDQWAPRDIFTIKNNKLHIAIDGVEQSAWQNREVITPGVWTKFIFVYDPVNITLTGYVDYELVGTWSIRNPSYPVQFPFTEIRMAASTSNTSINLDNFKIYSGSSFRITDKFDSMTLSERFEYFVNYMNDESRELPSRLLAYRQATALLEEIKLDSELSAELSELIEKYNAMDAENDIINPARAFNLQIIKEKAALLSAYEGLVNTSNYTQVKALVDDIDSFIADNSDYLDKSDAAYKDITANVSRFKSLLDRCNNVISFVNALERFDKSYTLAAKNKYYASAVQYYELAGLYLDDVRLEVMSDPAILAFEASINGTTPVGSEEYVDIFAYYENCGRQIDTQKAKENSDRIIDCLEFVTSLEDYSDTEEFWQSNFDYIDKYMTIIRDIVRAGSYDDTVAGVNEAIAKFRVIDVYFYNALQNEHIAFISEHLDKYAASESYIEKLGICTYVSNYIEANDIDESNPTVAALVLQNETYLGELEIYRAEYVTVLEQNTVNFVNTVEEMKTQVGYKKLSELYNKALRYYYEMNITDASKAAVETFEQYSAAIKKIEEDSALFVGYANAIADADDDAELFEALVDCKPYRDLVSLDIAGVSDAVSAYDAALSEYNAKADSINGDIAEINSAVTVMRTNGIASAIMSVINKIFNR